MVAHTNIDLYRATHICIHKCAYASVVLTQVMAQLSELCEEDVLEEINMLEATGEICTVFVDVCLCVCDLRVPYVHVCALAWGMCGRRLTCWTIRVSEQWRLQAGAIPQSP